MKRTFGVRLPVTALPFECGDLSPLGLRGLTAVVPVSHRTRLRQSQRPKRDRSRTPKKLISYSSGLGGGLARVLLFSCWTCRL